VVQAILETGVTGAQLYVAIGAPMLSNALLITLLFAYTKARFHGVSERFNGIDKRFDDMRDLWRAELRRVEEGLDARWKHLEESH
jgi:hypothetical protein